MSTPRASTPDKINTMENNDLKVDDKEKIDQDDIPENKDTVTKDKPTE